MPYIGAIKALIFTPIFEVFGSNIIVIRAVSVLGMALFLWLTYRLVSKHEDRRSSLITLLLLATNASIIIFGRTDFGPIVIEHIIFSLSLLTYLSFTKTRRLSLLLLCFLFLSLGLLNKLNFLWFINAFYLAILLVDLRFWRSKKLFFKNLKPLLMLIFFYVSAISYYLLISKHFQLGKGFHLQSLSYMFKSLTSTLGGEWFFNGLLGANISLAPSIAIFFADLAIILAALFSYKGSSIRPSLLFKMCLVIIPALLLQISVTPEATAGWHYLTLQPFWAILLGISLSRIWTRYFPKKNTLLIIVLLPLCFYQLSNYIFNIDYVRHPRGVAWSEAIYDLARYTSTKSGVYIVADWGLQTQLITFDPVKNKYYEVFGPIDTTDQAQVDSLIAKYLSTKPDQPVYIITHPEKIAIFPKTQQAVLDIAESKGDVELSRTFETKDGVIYQVYRFAPDEVQL